MFLRKVFLSALSLVGLSQTVMAQQAVQLSPSHLDAANLSVSTTAAVNTALTATLPAVAGKYHQISNLTITLCEDTTASTSLQLAVTSTNLGGWATQVGQASAAGQCNSFPFIYPLGKLSAAPGTATTIVVAQPGAHGAAIVNVDYSAVAGVSGNQ